MFDIIWKEQIAQGKSKLDIWKPKHELKPRKEEEDDDDCLRRLQRAVDEIRTQTMLFGLDQTIDEYGSGLSNFQFKNTGQLDNETACKVLELFSSNPNPFNGSGGGITYEVKRPNKEPIRAAIRRTITEYDGDIKGLFIIYIHGWGHILRVRVFKAKGNQDPNDSQIEKEVEQRLNNFWDILAGA